MSEIDHGMHELWTALETYNFDELKDIRSTRDIWHFLRSLFADWQNGIPIKFEDLAALAVVGFARKL